MIQILRNKCFWWFLQILFLSSYFRSSYKALWRRYSSQPIKSWNGWKW